jgi:hypothetical protein
MARGVLRFASVSDIVLCAIESLRENTVRDVNILYSGDDGYWQKKRCEKDWIPAKGIQLERRCSQCDGHVRVDLHGARAEQVSRALRLPTTGAAGLDDTFWPT